MHLRRFPVARQLQTCSESQRKFIRQIATRALENQDRILALPNLCHTSIGMKPTVIVWDLETVPDLSGFAAANDLVGKSDVEVREAIGDKFPKHIYHSIVCIGALIAHREPNHWAVDAVGAPHVGERTEKDLITAFCAKIAT